MGRCVRCCAELGMGEASPGACQANRRNDPYRSRRAGDRMIVQIANTRIKIEIYDTPHGAEIAVMDGCGVTTMTVFEFERFVHEAGMMARNARAKNSARARNAILPMRAR